MLKRQCAGARETTPLIRQLFEFPRPGPLGGAGGDAMGDFLYALWSFLHGGKAFWLVVPICLFLILLGSLLYLAEQ
jgi:hypothetical protein